MASLLSSLVLLAAITGAFSQYYPYGYGYNNYNYGYYGNSYGYIGYYGNQFSCGSYSYRAYCPDRTLTPGFCLTNTCAAFGTGYTCVNPGICCRTFPTTTTVTSSSCPTGLFSSTCPTGICTGTSAGQTCTAVSSLVGTSLLCCATTTAATNCATGVGAGTCLQTATGLTCGTGFVCTALGTLGNICCPAAAGVSTRSGRDKIICSGLNTGCNEGLICHDGRKCVNQTVVAKSLRSRVSTTVCPNDAQPTGMCNYNADDPKEAPTCTDSKSFCYRKANFCCPRRKHKSSESAEAEVTNQTENP
jgi:hypothetical protein